MLFLLSSSSSKVRFSPIRQRSERSASSSSAIIKRRTSVPRSKWSSDRWQIGGAWYGASFEWKRMTKTFYELFGELKTHLLLHDILMYYRNFYKLHSAVKRRPNRILGMLELGPIMIKAIFLCRFGLSCTPRCRPCMEMSHANDPTGWVGGEPRKTVCNSTCQSPGDGGVDVAIRDKTASFGDDSDRETFCRSGTMKSKGSSFVTPNWPASSSLHPPSIITWLLLLFPVSCVQTTCASESDNDTQHYLHLLLMASALTLLHCKRCGERLIECYMSRSTVSSEYIRDK